ncbi:hypothetical protein G6F59_018236 [Rhizopus arrhizus]|nr:hypothetical protein G6F59_018236 [Rhizopus arrhizus]
MWCPTPMVRGARVRMARTGAATAVGAGGDRQPACMTEKAALGRPFFIHAGRGRGIQRPGEPKWPSGPPASRCMWMWNTVCPACSRQFITMR